jgi:tRNA (guanine-N7-)-methyltransferase
MPHPYGHATRVPAEGSVPLDALVRGSGPCDLEVGFARGHFLFERAKAEPTRRLVGLEVRLKWVVLAEEKIASLDLGNVRVYSGDVRQLLPRLEGEGILETVFIHFPDPWWKRRHQHRLVLSEDMLPHYRRVLAPGGHLFVQTDVPDRGAAYRVLLDAAPGFARDEPEGGLPDNPYGIRSHREKKCLEAGLPIHRLSYRRV